MCVNVICEVDVDKNVATFEFLVKLHELLLDIVLGVLDSCIICYCLILLVFLFVYLYLFGLNRVLNILFGLFWLPKSPLLPRSGHKDSTRLHS